MKISKIIFALMALLVVVGCNPDNGGDKKKNTWGNEGNLIGEWELTSWDNKANPTQKIYLAFNEDGTFDLYQRLYSVVWQHYTGTFSLAGNTLSGVYSDGEAWSKSYTVSYAQEPKRIRLICTVEKSDVSIYTEVEIPADVIDRAVEGSEVRSVAPERFL